MRAQALSSKRTTIPSFRCTFFLVLTMMACLISPLLTLLAAAAPPVPVRLSPSERVFWTTTIILSPRLVQHARCKSPWISLPIVPCLFIRRLATHSTRVAPELSMQFSIVCAVWVSGVDELEAKGACYRPTLSCIIAATSLYPYTVIAQKTRPRQFSLPGRAY